MAVQQWTASLFSPARLRHRLATGDTDSPDSPGSQDHRPLSMNRPTPNPSQEGSKHSSASCPFPSREGLGVGSWSQCMRERKRRLSTTEEWGEDPGEGQTE